MCGPYTNPQSLKQEWTKRAKDIEGYHIHIYHEDAGQEWSAFELSEQLKTLFPQYVESTHSIGIVGPHTARNYEIDITKEGFAEVVQWLQMNNRGLSILVHPETGDVVQDHLGSSIWINKEKGYSEEFFKRFPKPQNTIKWLP